MITIELLIIILQFRLRYFYRKNRTISIDDPVFCGDSWTRTNDPIDVNDVLYHYTLYTQPEPWKPYTTMNQGLFIIHTLRRPFFVQLSVCIHSIISAVPYFSTTLWLVFAVWMNRFHTKSSSYSRLVASIFRSLFCNSHQTGCIIWVRSRKWPKGCLKAVRIRQFYNYAIQEDKHIWRRKTIKNQHWQDFCYFMWNSY